MKPKIVSVRITIEFKCIGCGAHKHMTIDEVPTVDQYGNIDVWLHCNRCGHTHHYQVERI